MFTRLTLLFALVLPLFSNAVPGEPIELPLGAGQIAVRVHFIQVNEFGNYVPRLTVLVENRTNSPWSTVRLKLDLGGLCNGEPRQWALGARMALRWAPDSSLITSYTNLEIPLVEKVDGCEVELVRAQLVEARSPETSIDNTGIVHEDIDFRKELEAIRLIRDQEELIQAAELERLQEINRKEAQKEALRQKRLADERRKRRTEEAARAARQREIEAAAAAEERRKIRSACLQIYKATADRRVSSLTVREEQQVRACQSLGLYPPD